ncbi:MAG: BREX system Lon protease-like protein BrxL [Christensenellaceae bacterium]|nr:BREX system Lon protease-like protein BrxL [Christensenellaceae bacterium]
MTDELKGKLKNAFSDMIVYKDLKKSNFFSTCNLPSFMRDYLLRKFQNLDYEYDMESIKNFIKKYLPQKDEWDTIKDRLIFDYESIKLLTQIKADIDINSGTITFTLPKFNLKKSETTIKSDVWERVRDKLTTGSEVWGVVELKYVNEIVGKKERGLIALKSFISFCPYNESDLDQYKDLREYFNIDEWIDIILGAIDYNPDGYEDQINKLTMIKRLLPFVEKRINIMELAPKGTGKSYLFGRLSRFTYLLSGGKISRSNLFYNKSKSLEGLIFHYDFLGIDEIQTITCDDVGDMRSVLKTYMEEGAYRGDKWSGSAAAGVVLLGNVDESEMSAKGKLFDKLPTLFKESALLDRFHGFIEGWLIPRMDEDLKMTGIALNTEYFTHILHKLRDDVSYRMIIDELIVVPAKADTRDTEAVKRLATGFLKLLFPHVRRSEQISEKDFKKYCLDPAVSMRGIILTQLGYIDTEFRDKKMPKFKVKVEK